MPDSGKPSQPDGDPGWSMLAAAVLCIGFLFFVLIVAEPALEPQTWPREAQPICRAASSSFTCGE